MNATTKCVTLAIVAISHAGRLPVPWHLYIHHSLLDIRYSNPHGDAQQTHDTPLTLNPTNVGFLPAHPWADYSTVGVRRRSLIGAVPVVAARERSIEPGAQCCAAWGSAWRAGEIMSVKVIVSVKDPESRDTNAAARATPTPVSGETKDACCTIWADCSS
jgi:hypothetical protein